MEVDNDLAGQLGVWINTIWEGVLPIEALPIFFDENKCPLRFSSKEGIAEFCKQYQSKFKLVFDSAQRSFIVTTDQAHPNGIHIYMYHNHI